MALPMDRTDKLPPLRSLLPLLMALPLRPMAKPQPVQSLLPPLNCPLHFIQSPHPTVQLLHHPVGLLLQRLIQLYRTLVMVWPTVSSIVTHTSFLFSVTLCIFSSLYAAFLHGHPDPRPEGPRCGIKPLHTISVWSLYPSAWIFVWFE